MDFNFREIMKRVIKYLVEAIVVALACYAIPKNRLNLEEIALIALVAAATFSILDTYMPRF
jgi:ABC-type Co2+ transport system permease subunit